MKRIIKKVKRIDRECIEGVLIVIVAFVEFYYAMWLCAIFQGY